LVTLVKSTEGQGLTFRIDIQLDKVPKERKKNLQMLLEKAVKEMEYGKAVRTGKNKITAVVSTGEQESQALFEEVKRFLTSKHFFPIRIDLFPISLLPFFFSSQ